MTDESSSLSLYDRYAPWVITLLVGVSICIGIIFAVNGCNDLESKRQARRKEIESQLAAQGAKFQGMIDKGLLDLDITMKWTLRIPPEEWDVLELEHKRKLIVDARCWFLYKSGKWPDYAFIRSDRNDEVLAEWTDDADDPIIRR